MAELSESKLLLPLLAKGDSAVLSYPHWGAAARASMEFLEDALSESATIAVTGADVTLTDAEERALYITVTGTMSASLAVETSGRKGFWIVKNGTTGAFALTFGPSAGTKVTIPQGQTVTVYCDGTNAVSAGSNVGTDVTPTDGTFLVGDGTKFVGESGATARASMGANNAANLTTGTLATARLPVDLGTNKQITNNLTIIAPAGAFASLTLDRTDGTPAGTLFWNDDANRMELWAYEATGTTRRTGFVLNGNTAGMALLDGTLTAPAFVGDGAAVTNVDAVTLDGLDSTWFQQDVRDVSAILVSEDAPASVASYVQLRSDAHASYTARLISWGTGTGRSGELDVINMVSGEPLNLMTTGGGKIIANDTFQAPQITTTSGDSVFAGNAVIAAGGAIGSGNGVFAKETPGIIYFRPNGRVDATAEMKLHTGGSLEPAGKLILPGAGSQSEPIIDFDNAAGIWSTGIGDIRFATADLLRLQITSGGLFLFNGATFNGSGAGLTSVPAASLTGTIDAARLSGTYNIAISGNAATASDATNLGGQASAFYRNASNINAGTIDDARLPTTMSGKNFTGPLSTERAGNNWLRLTSIGLGGWESLIGGASGEWRLNQMSAAGVYEKYQIYANRNGSVFLNYNGSKKIETTNTGVAVTGGITTTGGGLVIDGAGTFAQAVSASIYRSDYTPAAGSGFTHMMVQNEPGTTASGADNYLRPATVDHVATALPIIGHGQTWQDVSASRVGGTSYRNTTGRPIMVSTTISDSSLFQVSTNNSTWLTLFTSDIDQDSGGNPGGVIIPDDHYYKVVGTPLNFWELR